MKNTLAILALLVATPGFSQLVPNGGFEEWTTNTITRPYDWRAVYGSLGVTGCDGAGLVYEETMDAFEGESAIFLENEACLDFIGGFPVLEVGLIHTGNSGANIGVVYNQALDCNERPEELSFYYKFEPFGGDTAFVDVLLHNYDLDEFEITETIGVARGLIIEPTTEYTQYHLPITYLSGLTPSYLRIRFMTSLTAFEYNDIAIPGVHGHDGTNLTIDKVEFHGGTLVGEVELDIKHPITLSPNPSDVDFVNLNYASDISVKRIEIMDELGRLILRQTGSSSHVNMQSIDSGLYYFRVITSEGTETIRFIKL